MFSTRWQSLIFILFNVYFDFDFWFFGSFSTRWRRLLWAGEQCCSSEEIPIQEQVSCSYVILKKGIEFAFAEIDASDVAHVWLLSAVCFQTRFHQAIPNCCASTFAGADTAHFHETRLRERSVFFKSLENMYKVKCKSHINTSAMKPGWIWDFQGAM